MRYSGHSVLRRSAPAYRHRKGHDPKSTPVAVGRSDVCPRHAVGADRAVSTRRGSFDQDHDCNCPSPFDDQECGRHFCVCEWEDRGEGHACRVTEAPGEVLWHVRGSVVGSGVMDIRVMCCLVWGLYYTSPLPPSSLCISHIRRDLINLSNI